MRKLVMVLLVLAISTIGMVASANRAYATCESACGHQMYVYTSSGLL